MGACISHYKDELIDENEYRRRKMHKIKSAKTLSEKAIIGGEELIYQTPQVKRTTQKTFKTKIISVDNVKDKSMAVSSDKDKSTKIKPVVITKFNANPENEVPNEGSINVESEMGARENMFNFENEESHIDDEASHKESELAREVPVEQSIVMNEEKSVINRIEEEIVVEEEPQETKIDFNEEVIIKKKIQTQHYESKREAKPEPQLKPLEIKQEEKEEMIESQVLELDDDDLGIPNFTPSDITSKEVVFNNLIKNREAESEDMIQEQLKELALQESHQKLEKEFFEKYVPIPGDKTDIFIVEEKTTRIRYKCFVVEKKKRRNLDFPDINHYNIEQNVVLLTLYNKIIYLQEIKQSLVDILKHITSEEQVCYLIFQMLYSLSHLHKQGIYNNKISLSSFTISSNILNRLFNIKLSEFNLEVGGIKNADHIGVAKIIYYLLEGHYPQDDDYNKYSQNLAGKISKSLGSLLAKLVEDEDKYNFRKLMDYKLFSYYNINICNLPILQSSDFIQSLFACFSDYLKFHPIIKKLSKFYSTTNKVTDITQTSKLKFVMSQIFMINANDQNTTEDFDNFEKGMIGLAVLFKNIKNLNIKSFVSFIKKHCTLCNENLKGVLISASLSRDELVSSNNLQLTFDSIKKSQSRENEKSISFNDFIMKGLNLTETQKKKL